MTDPTQDQPKSKPARPPRKWLRRIVLGLFLLIFLVLIAGLGVRQYFLRTAEKRLEEAMAEADRLDPGWRWEDILAQREVIPDDKNSALLVLEAAELLPDPEKWSPRLAQRQSFRNPNPKKPVSLEQAIRDLPPNERLNDSVAEKLRAELEKVKPALEKARMVADRSKGRYPIEWKQDGAMFTSMPHFPRVHSVSRLLALDATFRAHEGDLKGAVASCRALLGAGQSLGDEPTLISQLTRITSERWTVQSLERVLAQGEIPNELFAPLEEALDNEAKQNILRVGLRGERASILITLERLHAGEIDLEGIDGPRPQSASWSTKLYRWIYIAPLARHNQAVYLAIMTKAINSIDQSSCQKSDVLDQLEKDAKNARVSSPYSSIALLLVSSLSKVVDPCYCVRAELHCARLALAVERYRLAHGAWPKSLEELKIPLPIDPFGGGALRYKILNDGVVVYSLGANEVDDGGEVEWKGAKTKDIGFRLWNRDLRGIDAQPAPIEKVAPSP